MISTTLFQRDSHCYFTFTAAPGLKVILVDDDSHLASLPGPTVPTVQTAAPELECLGMARRAIAAPQGTCRPYLSLEAFPRCRGGESRLRPPTDSI